VSGTSFWCHILVSAEYSVCSVRILAYNAYTNVY